MWKTKDIPGNIIMIKHCATIIALTLSLAVFGMSDNSNSFTESDRDIPISRLKATASSQRKHINKKLFSPANAIDGRVKTLWTSELKSLKNKGAQWIMLEFDNTYPVDAVRYYRASKIRPKGREYVNWIGRIQDYEIQVSPDGKSFTTVASGKWDKNNLKVQRVSFDAVKAKFVKLIGKTAHWDTVSAEEIRVESPSPPGDLKKKNNNPREAKNNVRLQILKEEDLPPLPQATLRDIPRSRMKASASSFRNIGSWFVPASAIDGNIKKTWVSDPGKLKNRPEYLTVELDKPYKVDAVRYYKFIKVNEPRYHSWIGRIQRYDISVSMDGKTFKKVASGLWDKNDLKEHRVSFPAVETKFVRLTAYAADRNQAEISELSIESPNPPKTEGKIIPVSGDSKKRAEKFSNRNSSSAVKDLSGRLSVIANLATPAMQEMERLNNQGKYKEALEIFNRTAIDRIKKINEFKLENLYILPNIPGLGVPEEMLGNIITIKGRKYDLGRPGTINWSSSQLPGFIQPEIFRDLLFAYAKSGKGDYLLKWSEYMDDKLMNDTKYRDLTSFTMVDNDSWGPRRYLGILVSLAECEAAYPGSLEKLPLTTLPRLFLKMVPEQNSLGAAYFHANAQNWTHHAATPWLIAAFVTDKLFSSNTPLAARTLRMLQKYDSLSNMPDGTEAEQAMWYNWSYAGSVLHFLTAIDTVKKLDPDFRFISEEDYKQLEDSMIKRIRFCSNMYTQQGEWPMFLRGDKRKGFMLFTIRKSGVNTNYFHLSLGKYADRLITDPVIGSVLKTIGPDKQINHVPGYTSNYFPWGGYRIIRENWKPEGQYGILFASPSPGKYGARGGMDNLNFGLAAYGVDLLGDNAKGHYSSPLSPLMVDGKNQNYRAGYPCWGHKQVLLNGWKEPDNSRFLSGDSLEFMEGTYNGTYGKVAYGSFKQPEILKKSIKDVTHQRQVIFIRKPKLWIVTDKLKGDKPHRYTWRWYLPYSPKKEKFFSYLPEELKIDEKRQEIVTSKANGVNFSMRSFSSSPLNFKSIKRNKIVKYGYYGNRLNPWNNVCEVLMTSEKQKELLTVFVIYPGKDLKDKLKSLKKLTSPGYEGFVTEMPDGTSVSYMVAFKKYTELKAGNISANANVLLVVEKQGVKNVMVLDCKELSVNGKRIKLAQPDATFDYSNNNMSKISYIYRPLKPVIIKPAENVFIKNLPVSFEAPDAGVEIRYTLDGSNPDRNSKLFKKPFNISKSTVVKSRSFRIGHKENADELNFLTASPVSMAVFKKEEPLNAQNVGNLVSGLNAKFYKGNWEELMYNVNMYSPARTGTVKELMDISLRDNKGVFAFKYDGYIDVPKTGVYTFYAPAEFMDNKIDNGYDLSLKIDGRPWIPSAISHSFGSWSVALERGPHKIELVYVDYRGDEVKMLLPDKGAKPWIVRIDYNHKGQPARNIPGMKGDYVWGGGVPELMISGPGLNKQKIPSDWLKRK